MKKYFFAAFVCFVALLFIPFISQASPLAYTTERISGQDRIETALSIAQKGWTPEQVHTVILCEFTDYPDSIAAAPFASSLDAPILLTAGNAIDQRVVTELERLKPEKVILLGGEGRLTPSIEKELESMSLSWERIGGKDRYETSVLLAGKLDSDSLIIANGDDFPDALSAASYAGMQQIPIVLTSKTVPASVAEYYDTTKPEHVIVIGGEGVVPTEALNKHNITVETRLGGLDRYETNAAVVSYIQEQDSAESNDLYLASGMDFPDAVAGTVLAAKEKAPLLLAQKEDIPPAVYSIMRLHMKVEPSMVTARSGQGKISANGGLNLRDTPSIAGKLQLTIPEGSLIDITSSQGNWYKTVYEGKSGWVSAEYVTIIQKYKQGEITAFGGLNLRKSPSTSGELLITIPERSRITIIEEQSDWYRVSYRGKTGWVYAEYVKVLAEDEFASDSDDIDLSPNGKVYILGGSGVISSNAQNIIKGQASSNYPANHKEFPSLPDSLTDNDYSQEELIDPFAGIAADVLSGRKIMIDPGHGGPDSGAIGWDYTYEKDNNLAIALFLNDILREAGAEVSMTRDSDISLAANYSERADLQARVDKANNTNPELFISIHNNAGFNPATEGTSVFYSDQNPQAGKSAGLANKLLTSITETVKTANEGVKEADYYVLRNTKIPAVLVEVAYLSNPDEEKRLKNPIFQKNVAAAIFHGLLKYYNL